MPSTSAKAVATRPIQKASGGNDIELGTWAGKKPGTAVVIIKGKRWTACAKNAQNDAENGHQKIPSIKASIVATHF